jgi:hypothetical protein
MSLAFLLAALEAASSISVNESVHQVFSLVK